MLATLHTLEKFYLIYLEALKVATYHFKTHYAKCYDSN